MYKYDFSIVMIAYNVEAYIGEAIDSVIAQDIGFDRVQLIVVNDGSTDQTAEIVGSYLDKYPNIRLVNKVNGGPSSARNEGIQYIEGKYANFMDSDDALEKDALRKVYSFFEKHYDETDLVSIPLFFFDAQTGEHHLNYKYHKGSRVIDLKEEWDAPQLQIASCFMKHEILDDGLRFDARISYADDCKFAQQVLLGKQTLGVVSDTKYLYRKRSGENSSMIQASQRRKNWYVPCMKCAYTELVEYYESRIGYLPRSVQNVICGDLQWKIRNKKIPYGVLSKEEETEYLELIRAVLQHIDNDIIMYQKYIGNDLKAAMLKFKGEKLHHDLEEGIPVLRTNDRTVYSAKKDATLFFDFIRVDQDLCTLEGRYELLGETEDLQIIINNGKDEYHADLIPKGKTRCVISQDVSRIYSFRITFPVYHKRRCRTMIRYGDSIYEPDRIGYGNFMPLSSEFEKMYSRTGSYVLRRKDNDLFFTRASGLSCFGCELQFLSELSGYRSDDQDQYRAAKKALLVRPLALLNRLFKRRPVWIFRDRVNIADDNAAVLFEYVSQKDVPVLPLFALSSSSRDYERISKIGRVIDCLSWKYKLLYLVSDLVISSAADEDVFNPYEGHNEPYKDLELNCRFVFLQHGVIHNDLSEWLNKSNVNISGFVSSAQREADFLRSSAYGYDRETIWLTGMPRYDRLCDDAKKIITFAPTWREYLLKERSREGIYASSQLFDDSVYYKALQSLCRNKTLADAAEKYGYQLQMILHPSMSVYKDRFADSFFQMTDNVSYQKIFADSSLFITDYSSAAFDFAYLKKPVLYYQFDHDDFFTGHLWSEGYFDFERDGFGEVEYDEEKLVKQIIEHMEHDCTMKDLYRKRADAFFAYHDQNNCERVLAKIRSSF